MEPSLVRPRVSVEEKSYLRTALLGCLVVAAVVLTVNTSSQGAKAMSLAAGDAAYGPPPPPLPPSAVPPAVAPTAMAEEAAEAPQPVAEAPVEAAAPPPGSYSYQPSGQVFGGVNTRGTITTGCSGGNCGEAGPTTAMGGNDYGVADYDKVKLERRQAMDFCDAHFHAWVNIQKCISELFLNARY